MILALRSIATKIRGIHVGNIKKQLLLQYSSQYFGSSIKLIQGSPSTSKKISNLKKITRINSKDYFDIEEMKEMIYTYPFGNTFQSSVKDYKSLDVPEEVKCSLIAWRCLQIIDKKQLQEAYHILFPEKYHLQMVETKMNYTGESIFSQHFQKKLPDFIEILNSEQSDIKEKVVVLNTLAFMKGSEQLRKHIKLIHIPILKQQDSHFGALLLAYLVMLRAKCKLQFADDLPELQKYLKNISHSQQKLKTVYILTLLPYFYKYYPLSFVRRLFDVLRISLSVLNCRTVFIFLKKVYQHNSKHACEFAEDLLDYLTQDNINNEYHSNQYLISLILKTISYCSVLNVDYEKLILHFYDHIDRFASILQAEGLSKQQFITKLFSERKGEFSEAGRQVLAKHIHQQGKKYMNSQQINENEYLQYLKLVTLYQNQLENSLVNDVSVLVLDIMKRVDPLPLKFNYENLHFILSKKYNFNVSPLPFTEEELQFLSQKVKKYLKVNSQTLAGGLHLSTNINQCINLISLSSFRKLNLKVEDVPNVCLIKFKMLKGYSIDRNTFENLINYLLEAKRYSSDHVRYFCEQCSSIIFSFLKRGDLNFNSVLALLQIGSSCGYRNSNFPLLCIRYITELMQKYPNFQINSDDVATIEKALNKLGHKHRNFKAFVERVRQKPQKWHECREKYLRLERGFKQKQQYKKPSFGDSHDILDQ